MTPRSLVKIHQCPFRPARQGSRFLYNNGKYPPAHVASQAREKKASENSFHGKLTHLLSQHEEIVNYMFRFAFKFLPEDRVLRSNTNRTSIQVALAHHSTSQHNQRGCAEAKFICSQQCGHHNIKTWAQNSRKKFLAITFDYVLIIY